MTTSHHPQNSPLLSAPVTRRTFFRGAIATAAVTSSAGVLAACSDSSSQPEPEGYDGERRQLPIPPLMEGEVEDTANGPRRVFRLEAMAGNVEILPETTTSTWGFNGAHLGPVLYTRRGDTVEIQVTNSLDETTTVHWHGMKLPAQADGGPHSPIAPGETWTPEFDIDQPAATLWFHPHPHEKTALHAYRGLAGMLMIDDDVAGGLDIPQEYGTDDIPVIVTDAKFNDDGQLDETVDPDLGLMGTTPVVNGITNAEFVTESPRLRLRLLNAAGMRFYNFAWSDQRSFSVIATDTGLLDSPVSTDTLLMGPGERAEIVVDLAADDEVTLVSEPRSDNFGLPDPDDETAIDFGFQDRFELVHVRRSAGSDSEPAALPDTLDPAAKTVPDLDGAVERDFELNTFSINGKTMDMDRIDLTIEYAGPEIWHVSNGNIDWAHNFHIHNARFRVIEVADGKVEVPTFGWLDTVSIPPQDTVSLAVEFGEYFDEEVPYMYHCHMLHHEDQGMMGQFVLTKPAESHENRS